MAEQHLFATVKAV